MSLGGCTWCAHWQPVSSTWPSKCGAPSRGRECGLAVAGQVWVLDSSGPYMRVLLCHTVLRAEGCVSFSEDSAVLRQARELPVR